MRQPAKFVFSDTHPYQSPQKCGPLAFFLHCLDIFPAIAAFLARTLRYLVSHVDESEIDRLNQPSIAFHRHLRTEQPPPDVWCTDPCSRLPFTSGRFERVVGKNVVVQFAGQSLTT
ncbi:MAG: hypothetical protein CBB71_16675 [Rhodopirellula sp. TMED11]|nr:MAG: hypothetical protein CBB71_16675 [Rhodopirellula sp. TMED11]